MSQLILFVCTGNTCRSPMAEALFKLMLPNEMQADWRAASAGIAAYDALPAASHAGIVVAEEGGDLSDHCSQLLTAKMVADAQIIIVMSAQHRDYIAHYFPGSSAKVHLLKSFTPAFAGDEDLADPYGGRLEEYRECSRQILSGLSGVISYLIESCK